MTKRSWLKPKEAAEYLHVSYQTLRKYTLEGKLEHDTTPGGYNVYTIEQFDKLLGKEPQPEKQELAIYARDSQSKQEHIDSQINKLTKAYGKTNLIYTDKASGLNENRKGLKRLIRDAKKGKYNTLAITAKDRLTRFGYTYLEEILNDAGVEILVLDDKRNKDAAEELVQDFLSLLASFSGKYYKLRGIKQEKMMLELAEKKIDEKKKKKDNGHA